MGNLCVPSKQSKIIVTSDDQGISSRQESSADCHYYQENIVPKRRKNPQYEESTANLDALEGSAHGNYTNSFAKKNEIGAYFCGGSPVEKDASSYPLKMEEFEGIVKRCVATKRSEEEDQLNEIQRTKTNNNIKQDMEEAFYQQFQFLPDLLALEPELLQQGIKKGLPIKYRWVSWKSHLHSISRSTTSLKKTKNLFYDLQEQLSKEEGQIDKDISRTFPTQPYFSTKGMMKSNQGDLVYGYSPLKRVLVSISNMYPDLGYCQGMNFILGFILMINGANQSEAFWMFKVLSEHPNFMLMGLYEMQLPMLGLLEYIAKKVLIDRQKNIMLYFEEQMIPDSFWLTKWFLTLFLYNFPVKLCSRFWDYLITSDIFSLVRLTVAILEIFKDRFMQGDGGDFMEYFSKLTQDEVEMMNPNSPLYVPIEDLILKADNVRLSRKAISRYSKHFVEHKNDKNLYAQLYSLYDDPEKFQEFHKNLVSLKTSELAKSKQNQEQTKDIRASSCSRNENLKQISLRKNKSDIEQRELPDNLRQEDKLSSRKSHQQDEQNLEERVGETSQLIKDVQQKEEIGEASVEIQETLNDSTVRKLIDENRKLSHIATIEFDKDSFAMFQNLKLKCDPLLATKSPKIFNNFNNTQNSNGKFDIGRISEISDEMSSLQSMQFVTSKQNNEICQKESDISSSQLSSSSNDDEEKGDYNETYKQLSISFHDTRLNSTANNLNNILLQQKEMTKDILSELKASGIQGEEENDKSKEIAMYKMS